MDKSVSTLAQRDAVGSVTGRRAAKSPFPLPSTVRWSVRAPSADVKGFVHSLLVLMCTMLDLVCLHAVSRPSPPVAGDLRGEAQGNGQLGARVRPPGRRQDANRMPIGGAGAENRTRTPLRAADFKSAASACSATPGATIVAGSATRPARAPHPHLQFARANGSMRSATPPVSPPGGDVEAAATTRGVSAAWPSLP